MVMESVPETDFDYNTQELDLNFPSVTEYTDSAHIPLPSSGNSSSSSSSATSALEPIPHSTSITSHYVKDLFELLQAPEYRQYQLSANFENEETTTENGIPGFNVLLMLECKAAGVKLKEFRPPGGCFPNRRLAKEAAGGLAIEWLKLLPEELTSLPPVVDASLTAEDALEETINWRGRLAGFCQVGPNANPPTFEFFQTAQKSPTVFSCELTGIQGLNDKLFGCRTRFYSSKKKACVQAAKEAMLYIEKHQIAPPESAKKANAPAGRTGGANGPVGPHFIGKVQPAEPGSVILVPLRATIHETILMVCPRLGLSLPEYKIAQDPETPSLYDVTAIIRRLPPRKGVRIGPIKGVYGRKTSKDTIARSVLTFLHKEAEGRQVSIQTEGS